MGKITRSELSNGLKSELDRISSHEAEYVQLKGEIKNFQNYSTYKSNVDVNGIFQEIQYKRADGTLMLKSVLSGGTSPEYTTRTVSIYENDGITVKNTYTYSITYTDGKPVSEVLV